MHASFCDPTQSLNSFDKKGISACSASNTAFLMTYDY